MSVFKPMSRTVLILLMGLLVVALTPLGITKRLKRTQQYVCDKCGAKLWASTDSLAGSSGGGKQERSLEATELSRWVGSHISTNCAHSWVQFHTSAQTYFALAGWRLYKVSGGSGGQVTPPLTYLFPDDRTQLENLLKESPTKCSNFIHEKLQLGISGKDE